MFKIGLSIPIVQNTCSKLTWCVFWNAWGISIDATCSGPPRLSVKAQPLLFAPALASPRIFPSAVEDGSGKMPKLVLKQRTSPNTRYLVRCFFQLQTSIDEMGQLDVFPIPSWTWKTRCSPRTRMQSRRTLLWNQLLGQSCTFFPCYRTSEL